MSFVSIVLVPTTANLARGFYAQVFKAGCKLVSFSRMAFQPVWFMSRRPRYSLRMCSTWLKLAQQHISGETSSAILAKLPQNVRRTLTAIDRNVWPSVIIKHVTGFIIALVVDEKFLDVGTHSLMLVNCQNTSLSHFIRNPTFGVMCTTERVCSKPQTTGGGNKFLEFLV